MIRAESVEFLPTVLANCWIGWIACRASSPFHPVSCWVVQSPYARLTVGTPYRASSARSADECEEETLSASMSTARRTVGDSVTSPSYHSGNRDAVRCPKCHARVVPTQLPLARHLDGLRTAMVAFVRYADRAGLDALVPTCPGWTVRDLVAYQGAAHRATAAMLRGGGPVPPEPMVGDPLEWLRDGAIDLVEAITRAPQEFWARRACHQTTLRAVDALAAVFGRVPDPAETWIEVDLAV